MRTGRWAVIVGAVAVWAAALSGAMQDEYVVPAGTRVLLGLMNTVNTKHVAPGDRVYLETKYPVAVNGRVVIPIGSHVEGTVTETQRAGHAKGRATLYIRFDSLLLPNGVSRDFRSRVSEANAKVDPAEGKITGDGGKGEKAKMVGIGTLAGTSVGALAGNSSGHGALGAGAGAGAGAVGGIVAALMTRGPDLVLPQGSTMEMTLDRELRFTAAELGLR